MAKKLTPAQRRVLENLSAGRSPTDGLVGMSAHGGFQNTWASLVRAGYVNNKDETITQAGKEALDA